MKFINFTMLILWVCLSYGQNVGIGTASPGTKLDVNGALTYRETVVSVSSNAATIPSDVSQVQLTGSATATITVTPPTPPNAGQVLVIYNNTTGGYGATIGSTTIPAGTALEMVYSNGAWIAADPEAGGSSSYYIQNQTSASQSGAGFNTAGSGTIAGTLTLTPMTSGSLLFAGTSGVVSQNNANLFWDNTNYRLGIGTASPSTPLHVVSAATTSLPISLMLGLQPNLATGNSVYEKLGVALSTANEVDLVFNYVNASTTTSTANSSSNNFGIGFYGVAPVASFYPNGNVLVHNLAGTGYRPVYADASGDLYTISGSGSNRKLFSYTGGSQSWTVPTGVNIIFVKLWGGGGGSAWSTGDGPGGGGGFVSGFASVTPGATLTIIVGQGGALGPNGSSSSGTAYGGGGAGWNYSGGGGGYSGIFTGSTPSSTNTIAVAGGGGGGGRSQYQMSGGAGGGLVGATGGLGEYTNYGGGGTQTGGGTLTGGGTSCTTAGSQFQGGTGCSGSYAGGGGGGWYGGGGAGNGGGNNGAGGGGSSYISGLIQYLPVRNEQGTTSNPNNGNYRPTNQPPGGTDGSDYSSSIGYGAATNPSGPPGLAGGNGQVVIYW